jgi:hypothetical protein
MEFKLTQIDPHNCNIDELKKEIERLSNLKEEYNGLQNSIKVFLNSIYGACASPYFVGFNVNVAEAITLQGQDIAKFASKIIDDYFINEWHLDKSLHVSLGITYANKINEKTVTVYMDTDSLASNSLLTTYNINKEIKIISIENWYNQNKNSAGTTSIGHESVKTEDKILNWSSDKNLYLAPVKRIIRHKVTKSKWKLKTKSGKKIEVTGDHSLVVFRNNVKLEIKPKDILLGDKVICIK